MAETTDNNNNNNRGLRKFGGVSVATVDISAMFEGKDVALLQGRCAAAV